jgi:hypothetical protein
MLTAGSAKAQSNTWTANFPKAVAPAGSFEVDGTAVADVAGGWALNGLGVVTYYKDGAGGGVVYSSPIAIAKNGKWNATIASSLGAGTKIVVIVQATQTKQGQPAQNIATASQTVTP